MVSACSTYYVSTTSLKNQFANVDSTDLKPVTVRGPLGEQYEYLANPLMTIKLMDKKGNTVELPNKPSIEMRITEKNGKRTIFYFDSIFLTDSTLVGSKSRFISSIRKTIYLDQIDKIEVQDGKKNFQYTSKK